jgi:carbon-monoxide dehydrogenase medium subunit
VKPPPFDYVVPENVEAAVTTLAQAGTDAKIIAGGQSLVPMLNFRLLRPSLLVDINRITELAFIKDSDNAIRVGALTRHHALETSSVIARYFPVLAAAMKCVAHLAIRNRGTVGGSLSHADPAAELPMIALLLDAELEIVSAVGRRTAAACDFYLGALTVDLAEDELVTAITFPKLPPVTGWGFAEVARRTGDFAIAAVAATLTIANGRITDARIGITGMGDKPERATEAEALLRGRAFEPALIDAAAAAACAGVAPSADLHASPEYRRHLVGVLTRRTLVAADERARRESA